MPRIRISIRDSIQLGQHEWVIILVVHHDGSFLSGMLWIQGDFDSCLPLTFWVICSPLRDGDTAAIDIIIEMRFS